MKTHLKEVIDSIAGDYADNIFKSARHYIEVSIGKRAAALGYTEIREKFDKVYAIVPLQRPLGGMKVRIDGRTFVNYAQYESGVAVPGYIACEAAQPYEKYIPNDSMILNCD